MPRSLREELRALTFWKETLVGPNFQSGFVSLFVGETLFLLALVSEYDYYSKNFSSLTVFLSYLRGTILAYAFFSPFTCILSMFSGKDGFSKLIADWVDVEIAVVNNFRRV